MEKKISDYLHLYLGCDIMILCYKDYSGGTYKLTGKIFANIIDNYNPKEDLIKPILRPLSDMTEEEREELNDIELGESSWPTVARALAPCFAWMLSKGFDLFGLIESGLAIDKTTLHSKQEEGKKL